MGRRVWGREEVWWLIRYRLMEKRRDHVRHQVPVDPAIVAGTDESISNEVRRGGGKHRRVQRIVGHDRG